ncbi:MAG: SDR family oxidoreductase [Alphaproteobacteria bacterium]|nr:SDR family oxidoreductase [Alphaproteobacteria bacterium]
MNTQKTLLITGGATRLGRETALHMAAKGWNIAVHYRDSAEAASRTVSDIIAMGREAVAIRGDLSTHGACAHVVQEASAVLGGVGALVNNAALFEKDNLASFTEADFRAHMDTNLLAPLLLAQAFAAQLGEGATGVIVNLLDGCEGMCLSPNFLTYTLSKYGLEDATKLLAQGLAPRIRVNAVAPGLTLPKPGEEEMFARLVAKLPVPQPTSPLEIASAVAYLIETPSLTGQIISLNGGAGLA